MPATVLVVEDEPPIRELIAYGLREAGHLPLPADDAEDAIRLVQEARPDLVLLDWMLPGLSGLELVRRLRSKKRTESIPIIMLTACGDEQHKLMAFDTGADDYVTKPFSPRELNARVKALLRRRSPHTTDDMVQVDTLRLNPADLQVTAGNDRVHLGPIEFRLLHFLMTYPERAHSRAKLLDRIWGDHVFVQDRTVDVHIRRLREALQPSKHDRLVQTVRGAGYRLAGG